MSSVVEVRKTIQKHAKVLYNIANDTLYYKRGTNVDGAVYYAESLWIPLDFVLAILDGLGKTAKTTEEILNERSLHDPRKVEDWMAFLNIRYVRWDDDKP